MPTGIASARRDARLASGERIELKLPFYFLVVFWGAKHRGYFVDYCLASMLAPGNVPALVDKAGSRFLVCTTADDWQALQADPLFRRLAELIAVELVEIDFPASDENKMNVMSRGHKRLTERAFSARAYLAVAAVSYGAWQNWWVATAWALAALMAAVLRPVPPGSEIGPTSVPATPGT